MNALFIPTENDFKNWIGEAVKESLAQSAHHNYMVDQQAQEPLINRKEIGSFLGISMVTLNEWMKKGLPNHKVNGRVYFQKSEVLEYVKATKRKLQ